MNLLFTICARAGSKGVKNKNIRNLLGYPILYYTLSAYDLFLRQYKNRYENIGIAINTDSEELVKQFCDTSVKGIHVPRKSELAGDNIGKVDVIKDTLLTAERRQNVSYNLLVDLDLTSPIRTLADIVGVIQTAVGDSQAEVAFSVTESRRSPYFNMVAQKEGRYYDRVLPSKYVSRQQLPECFDMNGSIYAYKRDYLMDFTNIRERKGLIWKMKDSGILDIDSENDYILLQVIAKYLYENDPDLICIKENIENIV